MTGAEIMKRLAKICAHLLVLFFALVGTVRADDFAHQFLGSPLLILVALLVIDAIAFVFHKIRR
jgi:cadmium resistance protein CadD (predicted permease)